MSATRCGHTVPVAILAGLMAFGSRFASKVLTTALGWASTLLFGRVPQSRQILLVGITFGSVIWMVLVAGIVVPDIGAFLLVLVPKQDVVPESTIRLVMLIGALVVPAVVGALTLALSSPVDRSGRRVAEAVARGYPLTVLLAVLLVFLAGLAIWRKAHGLARRWTDAHVPLVVNPGAYDEVAADLDKAVSDAGLEVEPRAAPAVMSRPAQWLAAVGGSSSSSLVPERMIQLYGPGLDILIYPMDLMISGKPELVARARAAMASRLTTSAAHLTVSAEAQAVEDRLTILGKGSGDADHPPRFDDAAAAAFTEIDETLATIIIPYEEWEVLYRQRLQVERDLRVGAMAGDAVLGAETPGATGPIATLTAVGRMLRGGADAVLDIATDDRTATAAGRLAGQQVQIGIRAAAGAIEAVRTARRGPDEAREPDDEDADLSETPDGSGEPVEAEPGTDQGRSTTP
jgi:hypothetical protein